MKKKIGILCGSLLFLVICALGILIFSGNGFVKGRLMKQNDSCLLVNEDTAMYMSVSKGMEKRLEKMSNGDEILLVHGAVEESFPARTRAVILIKLSDGVEADLPQETLNQFITPAPFQPGTNVTSSHEDKFINLVIPNGWEYEVKEFEEEGYQEFGIYFWPEGQIEGRLALMCAGENWAVCGTGLTTKEVVVGEYGAVKYIYDGDKFWTFLRFEYPEISYVVYNEGAEVWWDAYGAEAMQILSTVQLPK